MVNSLLELLGVACIVAFAYLLFAPAALLVAGGFLIVFANLRAARSRSVSSEGGVE